MLWSFLAQRSWTTPPEMDQCAGTRARKENATVGLALKASAEIHSYTQTICRNAANKASTASKAGVIRSELRKDTFRVIDNFPDDIACRLDVPHQSDTLPG